ncbi:unnamed protein product [Phytomonas sp. EM1]|nr:unnamed protein product [Phytomonas sp. EM1]|eukprot:CCW65219.1 unnamed protein product [Phytomonas sp. isolate EM1]
MNEKERVKEQWLLDFQFFLSGRLHTPPYVAAARSYPLISLPSMIPHTQYLLDGIVWSLNEHSEWALEAWLVIQNHLKTTVDRLQDVARDLADGWKTDERVELDGFRARERTYGSHAAVQDVYLAFCVVDAVLKHVRSPKQAVKQTIEKALPHLVVETFPILQDYPRSPWMESATDEFRLLFLDFLRSWTASGVEPETNRRLEEHIRHCLKVRREAAQTGPSAARSTALQDGLRLVLDGASPAPAISSASTSLAPASGDPAGVEKKIRSFLASINPHRRSLASRLRCAHCGAPLRDEASKNAHYRIHFHGHNYLRPEVKMVRLMYPTVGEFIDHVGDIDRRGYFAKVVDVLEELYKHDGRGALKVRRLEDLPESNP